MNTDLDDRLIPSGEYRGATNIAVSKSEGDNVGALESIVGNALVAGESLFPSSDFEIIGYCTDESSNKIITFVTNYTDPNPQTPTSIAKANEQGGSYESHICVFDPSANSYIKVVSGAFLNFSKTERILGVSLIENLLFFTDNRNQPRKINIQIASSNTTYYTSEDTISVAKYSPYEPISLVKRINKTATAASTDYIELGQFYEEIELGMTVTAVSGVDGAAVSGMSGTDFLTVSSISATTPFTIDTVSQTGSQSYTLAANDKVTFLKSTMTKELTSEGWPGDPDLIEDKYIRFSYRFKFDDGEYSITAPFTQIAYVPKQKGYFHAGDEEAAYRSTVLDFMSNEINNVQLLIPLPSKGSRINSEYKISSIDVLYKESDALALKVLDTVDYGEISAKSSNTNVFVYEYQSRKPYKTLPESVTTRVYDKVPVKAFAQETSGNRIMYGNFIDKYTAPASINYKVGIFDRDTLIDDSYVEYPNHTVKQNRNYQVGFVLSDKFGRQSSVILSPVDSVFTTTSPYKSGSTLYHPYTSDADVDNLIDWFGDGIQLEVSDTINSGTTTNEPNNNTGEPGLYAVFFKPSSNPSSGEGFAVNNSSISTSNDKELSFELDSSTGALEHANIPEAGAYLRGKYRDYVKVTSVVKDTAPDPDLYTVVADGEISEAYNTRYGLGDSKDIKFAYSINPVGWYSYKLVVKQTEQEYYNCYLPGILNGYPTKHNNNNNSYPTNETGKTAHVVLLNDNINKIPRDLAEVGPEQKQFRSSVNLYGRVENAYTAGSPASFFNAQYFPGREFHTASTVATATDLNMQYGEAGATTQEALYQLDTNPLIARISTLSQDIGVVVANATPILSVYETEPVTSLLDIFWESSTSGLISDLNEDILTGFTGIVDIQEPTFTYHEHQDPEGTGTGIGAADSKIISSWFFPTNNEGLEMRNTGALATTVPSDYSGPIFNATRGAAATPTNGFSIEQNTSPTDINTNPNLGAYRIVLSGENASYNHFSPPSTNDSNHFYFSASLLSDDGVYSKTFSFDTEIRNNIPFLWDTNKDQSRGAALPVKTLPPSEHPMYQTASITNTGTVGYGFGNSSIIEISNGAKYYPYNLNWKSDTYIYLTKVPKRRISTAIAQSPFLVNHSTGALGINIIYNFENPGINGGVMVGEYDLELKVKDAMSNLGGNGFRRINDPGTPSANTLQSSAYTQKIVVQTPSLPSNFGTDCISTGFTPNSSRRGSGDTSSENPRYWQWYVSDSVVDITNKPSDANAVVGPSQGSYSPVSLSSESFQSTNANGTMLLDLMFEVKRKPNNTTSSVSGFHCTWRIWHRNNSSASWSVDTVVDTNNTNPNDSINNNSPLALGAPSSYASNIRSAINVPVAFDKKGDYFIEAELVNADYQNMGSSAPTEAEVWVNCTDAHYPTSVIVDGKNMIDEESGRDSDYFQFSYSTGNSGTITGGCQQTLNNTVYARTPYAHIVTEFFSDTGLTTKPVITSGGQYKKYQYLPSDSSYSGIIESRTAKIASMTQISTTNATDADYQHYKTNKNYIYTEELGGYSSSSVYRKKCSQGSQDDTTQFFFSSYAV